MEKKECYGGVFITLENKKNKPKYLFLENVDRLLKSPSNQRGRDFAVILKSLDELGYAVEWRVINAADYGMPQRRRRVFILAYHRSTAIFKSLNSLDPLSWIVKNGTIAQSFPVKVSLSQITQFNLKGDLVTISNDFNLEEKLSPFQNTGILIDGIITTTKTIANYKGPKTNLGDILFNGKITDDFIIPREDIAKWEYLKGAKKELRQAKNGFQYQYGEGNMLFPDNLENASRTIITGEGGKSPSRFKHVVKTKKGLRRLTPIELERLNMFPDNHTKLLGISDTKRAFFMGNALVVGVVEQIGKTLFHKINQ